MQPKTSVKFLIEESLKGNFRNVYSNILSNRLSIDTHNAIKIIVGICNCCYKNFSTPLNVNEKDLGDLVKCLLKYIHVPSDEQYESYAQSVFYIFKLLVEKKNYDSIIQLKAMFIPEFMPLILTDKHFTIYQSICKSIYNIIVRLAQAKDVKHTQRALKLSYLLSEVYKKLNKTSSLFESGHNCMLALVTLETAPNELLQFYQHLTIDRIEESFYPSIINNFSLMYTHLLRIEQFTLAQSCYKVTIQNITKLFKSKEFKHLNEIMTIVEWLNPCNIESMSSQIPIGAHTSLRNLHLQYKSTPNLQSVCDFISSVAFTVLQLHKKSFKWSEKIDIHCHFYKFMNNVALIMSKTVYPCHCKNCLTKTNLNEALRTLNTIGGFGRLAITSKSEVPRTYKMEILRYLEKYIDYVTTLKDNKCEKWKKYWYDVGVHLYSIGIHLYQKNDTEMFVLYLQKFIQTLLEFEGFQPKLVEKTYLTSALNSIADSYYESRDYEKCLLVTALSIIVSDSPKSEINRWMRAKAASRDNSIEDNLEIQELTLVSICHKNRSDLETYLPKTGLQLSTKRKIELLVYELRQYNAKWRSKIPMSSVFRDLSKIANSQITAEVFIEIWGDGDMLVHDTLPKLLQDTITRVELEKVPKKDLLLAHLYFLQHKYRVKDAIVKHCDEMERTMNLTKASHEVINGVVPPDPNDECDLVSSYECLKLSRYVTMMKELNRSLELTQDWVSKNKIDVSDSDNDRLYKLLANTGHEFALHAQITNALQAWELALRVAKSPLQKLQATGFVIEMSNVRKSLVRKMIHEAESGVAILTESRNFEEVIVYYLCKTEGFFYVDFDTAYASFRQALRLHRDFPGSNLLKARIYLLQHKFNMLPCKFGVEGHVEYSLVKLHQANGYVNSHYKDTPGISSYDMRIFFEVYETLSKMYNDLRLPREVRCYAKDAVVIAQQMLLPLRTIHLLFFLANADLRTCRLDDCRVKIKDFSDILGLSKHSTVSTAMQLREKARNDMVEVLARNFNEMMLDVPGRVKPTSSGSPTFSVETFKLPSFFTHEESCECFYCTSVEYHDFVLKKTYLNALLAEHEENAKVANDFYCGAIKIYDLLRKKEALYLKKVSKKVSVDLVPEVREKLVETYCAVVLECGNFMIRSRRYTEAENSHRKLMQKIESFSLKHVYLYNEALMQKLNILMWNRPREKVQEVNLLTVDTEDAEAKTPPSHELNIIIPHVYVKSASKAPPKIQPKSLKFDLCEAEEESVETTKIKSLPSLPKNLPPPLFNLGAKTPAPSSSKVKIYTNKSAKKTKTVLSEIPFKEPELKVTVQSSTPSLCSANDILASRTKLLTERLKNSNRKEAKSDENAKSGDKKGVRQNLMSQWNDAEDSEGGGGLRRSARNRK